MPATGTSSSCGRCCSSRSSVFSRSRPRMRRWRRSLPAALLFRSPRLRLRRENSWSRALVLMLLVGAERRGCRPARDPVRTHADGRRGHASDRARRGGDGASAARSHRPHPGDGARGIPAWRPDPARRAGWRRIRRRTDAHGRRDAACVSACSAGSAAGAAGAAGCSGAAAAWGGGGLVRRGLLGRARTARLSILRRADRYTFRGLSPVTRGLQGGEQNAALDCRRATKTHLLGELLELRQLHLFKILAIGHCWYLSFAVTVMRYNRLRLVTGLRKTRDGTSGMASIANGRCSPYYAMPTNRKTTILVHRKGHNCT